MSIYWLNKTSRHVVIFINRQRTNKLIRLKLLIGCTNRTDWHTYWHITLDSELPFLYNSHGLNIPWPKLLYFTNLLYKLEQSSLLGYVLSVMSEWVAGHSRANINIIIGGHMSRCPAHTLDPYRQGAGTYYANTHFYKYPLILYLSPPDKSQTQEPTQQTLHRECIKGLIKGAMFSLWFILPVNSLR